MIPSERTLHRVGGRNTGTEREKVRIEPWHTQNTPSTRRRMAADHEARTIKPFCRKTPVITPPTLHQPPPPSTNRLLLRRFSFRARFFSSLVFHSRLSRCPPSALSTPSLISTRFPPATLVLDLFLLFLSSFSFFSPRSFFLSSLLSPCTRSLYRGLW